MNIKGKDNVKPTVYFDDDFTYAWTKSQGVHNARTGFNYSKLQELKNEVERQFTEQMGKEFRFIKINSTRLMSMVSTEHGIPADVIMPLHNTDIVIEPYIEFSIEVEEL